MPRRPVRRVLTAKAAFSGPLSPIPTDLPRGERGPNGRAAPNRPAHARTHARTQGSDRGTGPARAEPGAPGPRPPERRGEESGGGGFRVRIHRQPCWPVSLCLATGLSIAVVAKWRANRSITHPVAEANRRLVLPPYVRRAAEKLAIPGRFQPVRHPRPRPKGTWTVEGRDGFCASGLPPCSEPLFDRQDPSTRLVAARWHRFRSPRQLRS